jgi:putative DNA primase/helicase
MLNKKLEFYEMYVDNGWSCVPVNSAAKKGSMVKSWKEFQSRIPSINEINKWMNEYPSAGIGIITGKNSGVIVLDIDPRHNGHLSIKGKIIPPTVSVKTGGGGTHYYFRYPEGLDTIKSRANILPGIDLRADGGMAFAPPSIHPSKKVYEFYETMGPEEIELAEIPEWLLSLIKEKQNSKNYNKKIDANDWSIDIIDGNRNNSLTKLAGSLIGQGIEKQVVLQTLLAHNDNKCKPPLDKNEVISIVDSIYSRENNDKINKLKKKILYLKQTESIDFQPYKLAKYIINYLRLKKDIHLRYIAENEIFMIYNNGVWVKDNTRNQFIRKEIRKFIIGIKKHKFNRDHKITEILSNIKDIIEGNAENFKAENQSINIINLKNGILDLKEFKLKKHDHKIYSIFQFPINYNPEAECPLWEKSLNEWIGDSETIKFLQEYVGYLLIPDNSAQKFPILIGEGANGKSVFTKVIENLLGDNISNNSLEQLTGGDKKFNLINLNNKLANICGDIDGNYINKPSTIRLITGEDSITANRKFKSSVTFEATARLMFTTNDLPKTNDKNYSWYRRFEIIRFPNRFTPEDSNFDPKLKEKLFEELPGVLNWAIEGLKIFKENNKFTISTNMQLEKNRYMKSNDTILNFIDENVDITNDTKNDIIPTQKLFEEYIEWCQKNNYNTNVSKRKFSTRLNNANIKNTPRRPNGKLERCYLGVKFIK